MSGLAALSSAVTAARFSLEKKKNAVRFFFGALGSFFLRFFLPSLSPCDAGDLGDLGDLTWEGSFFFFSFGLAKGTVSAAPSTSESSPSLSLSDASKSSSSSSKPSSSLPAASMAASAGSMPTISPKPGRATGPS